MRGYTQLAQSQKYQIEALLKAGHTQTEIAKLLEVHKSTISRERSRNRGLCGYRRPAIGGGSPPEQGSFPN